MCTRLQRAGSRSARIRFHHCSAAPFFFDSGFAGLRARLKDIADLGATVLWLSPVTGTAEDDFGYAITDHFGLRQTFGSEIEFRQLVSEAHAAGLRVILDFVPNHFPLSMLIFVMLSSASEDHPIMRGSSVTQAVKSNITLTGSI